MYMTSRQKIFGVISTFLLSMAASGEAWAATYYVATGGSDSAAGSQAAPWRTIAYAVDRMQGGDTTYVKGGVYNETNGILFRRSGTASAPIKLLNAPGESPIIDFGGAVGVYHADGYHPERARGTNKSVAMSNSAGSRIPIGWITFEGFEVRNGYNGIKVYNGHDITIRRNWIHHNISQGIGGNGKNILVDRNVINRQGNFAACEAGGRTDIGSSMCNQVHGIYVTGSNWVITNNLIYDNLAMGITVAGYEHCPQGGCFGGNATARGKVFAGPEYGGADNWLIANNTFAYNAYRPAISLWQRLTTNSKIINNIFYENSPKYGGEKVQGISGSSAGRGHVIENNLCYSTKGYHCISPNMQGKYTGSNNITANPNFEGAGPTISGVPNFKLKTGSPAIDKGQSLAQVTWDHAGGKRPFGAAFDIGAYEFGSPPDSGSPPPNPTGGDFPSGPPVLLGPNGEVCPSGYL